MLTRFAIRTSLALIVSSLLSIANATPPDPLYCSRPLRVALFEFGILYRSATQDGADGRLMTLLQKRTGCQLNIVVLPRTRVWAEMKAGTLDMATAVIATPERESYSYILPYLQTRNVVLMQKKVAGRADSLETLAQSGLRMGAVRSFHHEPSYDALLNTLRERKLVLESVDVQENLRFLQRGMVDAVLSQPVVYRAYLSDAQLRNDIVIRDWAPPHEASVGGLMLSRTAFTEAQARRWDKLLETLQKDGSQIKTFLPYMSATEARELVYTGPRTFSGDSAPH
ncbi:MAG: transporter substrate-binding domain-containing protein [Rhodoferax sp.]|nr:transporter substrate-binding domain-containing protein [Rhodoferax sp.]